MEEAGKLLIYAGVLLIVVGLLMLAFDRFGGLPFGKLPGDIYIRKNNFVFYFPVGTSILISVLLSVLLFVVFLLSGRR
jgi:hypothetical protein